MNSLLSSKTNGYTVRVLMNIADCMSDGSRGDMEMRSVALEIGIAPLSQVTEMVTLSMRLLSTRILQFRASKESTTVSKVPFSIGVKIATVGVGTARENIIYNNTISVRDYNITIVRIVKTNSA